MPAVGIGLLFVGYGLFYYGLGLLMCSDGHSQHHNFLYGMFKVGPRGAQPGCGSTQTSTSTTPPTFFPPRAQPKAQPRAQPRAQPNPLPVPMPIPQIPPILVPGLQMHQSSTAQPRRSSSFIDDITNGLREFRKRLGIVVHGAEQDVEQSARDFGNAIDKLTHNPPPFPWME